MLLVRVRYDFDRGRSSCKCLSVVGCSLNPTDRNVTVPTLTLTPGLTTTQGTCIEAILTFNLLFVALSVTEQRGKTAVMPSFPIAFSIGCGILAAVWKRCFVTLTHFAPEFKMGTVT